MVILETMKEVFDLGDPLVRSWPLVHSYWTPFVLSGLYVIFVKRIGPALMHNRKPFDLRNFMILYNFSIVCCYIVCLLTLMYNFIFNEAYKNLCNQTPVIENHYTHRCASAGWYIYILKYVEFADTVFFILRKKYHLITNLHVIHHSTLPIICWMMLRTERSGFQFIPAGINCFIHIIMYTYYGLAAMGPEVRKKLWWKEYLTMLQMIQFVVILLCTTIIAPLSGCTTTKYGIYLDILAALTFLSLFYNFYNKTYKPAGQADGTDCKISNGVNDIQNREQKNGKHMQNGRSLKES